MLALLAAFALLPSFTSTPNPATSYEDSLARFAALEATEATLPLSQAGRSRLLTHGGKTERVFVLLHGLTNAPEQFLRFAKLLFDSGANVVIPRARYGGFADVMNVEQGRQDGQDLIDQAALGLDIAAGLGNSVHVVGLSGSAVAAAWMAQNRDGISSATLIAPFFGVHGRRVGSTDLFARVLSRSPIFFQWWDPDKREDLPGPPYAYPRISTRTLASTIRLSADVRRHLPTRPLRVKTLNILTSGADQAVNNALTKSMANTWAARGPAQVNVFNFPEDLKVPHDMIDPLAVGAVTDITYPKLFEMLEITN